MVEVTQRTSGIVISLESVYTEIQLLVGKKLNDYRLKDFKADTDSVFKNIVNSVMQQLNHRTSKDSAYFENCQSYFVEVGWSLEESQAICSTLEVKTILEIFSHAPFLESSYVRATKHIFLPSVGDILIFVDT